jgi:hypothetical protein
LNAPAGGGNGAAAGAANGNRGHRTRTKAGKTKPNGNADLADDPVINTSKTKAPSPAPGEAAETAPKTP